MEPVFGTEGGPSLANADSRRVVTILFADLVGSTRLAEQMDPEPLRELLNRYYAAARSVIEAHGGMVEKFAGDAVMAVFGMPVTHEDDALRAARAALTLGRAVGSLATELRPTWDIELQLHVGLNTGEVMAASSQSGETLVTGDAVNVAARLQEAAQANEILIGPETERRIRPVAELAPLPPMPLHGKAAPVAVFRLTGLTGIEAIPRKLDLPLVGRAAELDQLTQLFDQVVTRRKPALVTVLGSAGIGKSRLVAELARQLIERATILRGRCLPYGQAITYWPITELVHDAAGITADDARAEAHAKLAMLVRDVEHADLITSRVAILIGIDDGAAPPEELAWAVRRLLTHLADRRPLLAVLDDIQWAEPALLDLVEQLAAHAEAPLMLLTMARPELLENRPTWGTVASLVDLEPLGREAAGAQLDALLAAAILSDAVRGRVLDAAEGNPLYVEQFVGMLQDDPSGATAESGVGDALPVPPSIHALLAARLDHLPGDECSVLERGSVIGRTFWWGAVSELTPESERASVGPSLASLVRRHLLRPDASTFVADEAFRFHHLLLRDTAYARLPKAHRAELHAAFAEWLLRRVGDRLPEFEEIVAHHYESAEHLFRELGRVPRANDLGESAFTHLAGAARRARTRSDPAAAVDFGRRALAVPLQDRMRQLMLVPDLARPMFEIGDVQGAVAMLDEARNDPRVVPHPRLLAAIELERTLIALVEQSELRETQQVVDRWLPVFDGSDDDETLARIWQVRAAVEWGQGRVSLADEAIKAASQHAARAERPELVSRGLYLGSEYYGRAPAGPAIAELLATVSAQPDLVTEAMSRFSLTGLEAARGNIEAGRQHYERCRSILAELGMRIGWLGMPEMIAQAELTAGDPARAELALRESIELLEAKQEAAWIPFQSTLLAVAIAVQGRSEEALLVARRAESAGAADDNVLSMWIHFARSIASRQLGIAEEALVHAEAGLAAARATDGLTEIGNLELERAQCLHDLGRSDEALLALDAAASAYEEKEHLVGQRRVADVRAQVGSRSPRSVGPAGGR